MKLFSCPCKSVFKSSLVMTMDINVGDVIITKKQHPCGGTRFLVLRVGMDFRIRCEKCGREVMLPRAKIEKNIKKVVKPGQV